MLKKYLSKFRTFIFLDAGSAIVEFVLLAIPLFLGIYLYLGNFAQLSDNEIVARSMVRESLRAFVLSPNFFTANSRANETLYAMAKIEGLNQSEIDSMRLSFNCDKFPCLSKEGRVQATLEMLAGPEKRRVRVSAEEFVSPWKWTQY